MRTFSKFLGTVLSVIVILSVMPMVSLASSGSGTGVGCTYTFSNGVLDVNCNDRVVTIYSAVSAYGSEIKTVNLDISGIALNTAVEIYGNDVEATAVNVTGRSSGTYEKFSLFNFPDATALSVPTGITYGMFRLSNVGVKSMSFSKNLKCDYFYIKDCDYLTSVTFPTTTYQAEIRNCAKLATIVANDGLVVMNLVGLSKLTTFNSPSSIKNFYLTKVGATSITVPNAEEVVVTGGSIQKITFASGIKTIDSGWFTSCSKLNEVTIPKTVTYVDTSAFTSCGKVATVNYEGTKTEWTKVTNAASVFSGALIKYGGGSNITTGWVQEGSVWHYYNSNGVKVTGWQKIDELWYYFNSNGDMMKYWQKIDGSWYYFCGSGNMVKHWQKIGNDWYYFNASGVMQTGWQKINNVWYYFKSTGVMLTGWQQIDGKWYYLESDGHMITGWRCSGGYWYYFKDTGEMKTGWHCSGSTWYYFDSDGRMVYNKTLNINGKDYNFDSSGKCTNP